MLECTIQHEPEYPPRLDTKLVFEDGVTPPCSPQPHMKIQNKQKSDVDNSPLKWPKVGDISASTVESPSILEIIGSKITNLVTDFTQGQSPLIGHTGCHSTFAQVASWLRCITRQGLTERDG